VASASHTASTGAVPLVISEAKRKTLRCVVTPLLGGLGVVCGLDRCGFRCWIQKMDTDVETSFYTSI